MTKLNGNAPQIRPSIEMVVAVNFINDDSAAADDHSEHP
jgi:hypothetical protein